MLTDFQEDLRDGMSIDDALRKYEITLDYAFHTLHKPLLYTRNPKKKRTHKYIQERNGKYYVRKQINGKIRTFGTYDSYNNAKRLRDYCIKHGWKQRNVDKYCEELGITRVSHPLNNARYH